jgi:hypothetical protein
VGAAAIAAAAPTVGAGVTVVAADPVVSAGDAAVAGLTPQRAVDRGAREAADALGATTYAAVIDRRTGAVLARTDNADTQVASESLVKVLLAGYYLVKYDGDLPKRIAEDLYTMIVASDDDLCSAYWTDAAVPAMANRYRLDGIELADNPGHWGATRVTAIGMAEFLYRMSKDKVVGPWLIKAMMDSHDNGSDGFDQNFGFNALPGVANKQGWGSDNEWHEQKNAVHSIGLTKHYAAAVLQTGPSGVYRSLRPLASRTAELIADATPPESGRTSRGGGVNTWWSRAIQF